MRSMAGLGRSLLRQADLIAAAVSERFPLESTVSSAQAQACQSQKQWQLLRKNNAQLHWRDCAVFSPHLSTDLQEANLPNWIVYSQFIVDLGLRRPAATFSLSRPRKLTQQGVDHIEGKDPTGPEMAGNPAETRDQFLVSGEVSQGIAGDNNKREMPIQIEAAHVILNKLYGDAFRIGFGTGSTQHRRRRIQAEHIKSGSGQRDSQATSATRQLQNRSVRAMREPAVEGFTRPRANNPVVQRWDIIQHQRFRSTHCKLLMYALEDTL